MGVLLSTPEISEILTALGDAQSVLSTATKDRLVRGIESDTERESTIRVLAREFHRDGDLEIEGDAIISEGDDNGAYILGWKWIDFTGTALDKFVCAACGAALEGRGTGDCSNADCREIDRIEEED